MHVNRLHKKRLAIGAILLIFMYVWISNGYYQYEVDTVIAHTKPDLVWEYVADFSKMKLLNPTIIDFTILSDSGTYDHWKYSVRYTEKLSHWPYWINIGHADYTVRKKPPVSNTADDAKSVTGPLFVVESNHKICFFRGLYCLRSEGEFQFSARGPHTFCYEIVRYQCPLLMGSFCRREVEFQRKAIMHNLTLYFNKQNN